MKAKAVSNLLIGVGGVAGLLLSTGAIAVPYTNTAGSICRGTGSSERDIQYSARGVYSSSSDDTVYIVCPLSRDTQLTNGATAYVDIYHAKNARTLCRLYSYSYTGNLLGYVSQAWSGSNFHEFKIVLEGRGRSDAYSDYVVECYIPGSSIATILGVDLWEK